MWLRCRVYISKWFASLSTIPFSPCSHPAAQIESLCQLFDFFFSVIFVESKVRIFFRCEIAGRKCWYTRCQLFMQWQHNPTISTQTRNNFVSTKQEVEKLMKRIRSADQDYKPPGQWTMEGFLYIQEKRESFQTPAAPRHTPPRS